MARQDHSLRTVMQEFSRIPRCIYSIWQQKDSTGYCVSYGTVKSYRNISYSFYGIYYFSLTHSRNAQLVIEISLPDILNKLFSLRRKNYQQIQACSKFKHVQNYQQIQANSVMPYVEIRNS